MTPQTIAVIVSCCVAFIAGVALVFFLVIRDRDRLAAAFDAQFLPLDAEYYAPRWMPCEPGMLVDVSKLVWDFNRAVDALMHHGPWAPDALSHALSGVRIMVHNQNAWVDSWGRHVAGLSVHATRTIEVGEDRAALCHELGELVYTDTTGDEDFQAVQWPGREAMEAAITIYLQRDPR